jgi:hypothetical protein
MTERGLPIVDGAPACPFVAFADDRDERAASPDHRHRCYAEPQPAPRALAHQEAYCLSSAFPVCPTFQDWAKREAARAREDAARSAASQDAPDQAGQPQRNPPRNWAAPPPWLSRSGRGRGEEPPAGSLWAGEDADSDSEPPFDEPAEPPVPRRGRGLSGSYADRVAADSEGDLPGGLPDDEPLEYESPRATAPPEYEPPRPAPPAAPPVSPPARTDRPEPAAPVYQPDAWDEDAAAIAAADAPMPRRHRDRDLVRGDRSAIAPPRPGGLTRPEGQRVGQAPEWERAKPLEAYPTIRSRRLSELSIPPILVAVVALALAAAVLFALPGLLGFGNPQAGASPTPSTPIRTAIPSVNPTAVPQPTPQLYTVKSGDTMSRIAGRFGIPLNDLIAANTETVPDPNKLQLGQQIIIPAKTTPASSEIPGST